MSTYEDVLTNELAAPEAGTGGFKAPHWPARHAAADLAYSNYNFGEGVFVESHSGWEYTTPGNEMHRVVFVLTDADEGSDRDSTRLTFAVRFRPGDTEIQEVYALDRHGAFWGYPWGDPSRASATDSAIESAPRSGRYEVCS